MTTVDQLLTVRQVSALFQMTNQGVYKLVYERKVPSIRVGSRIRFRKRDIDAYLDSRTTGKSKVKAATILTVRQVSALFQMTNQGVYKLVYERKVPSIRVGSRIRFRKRDIDAYLDSRTAGKSKVKAATIKE